MGYTDTSVADVKLSGGDVCEVSGLAPSTLDAWTRGGVLGLVANDGAGHGSQREFSLGQALAARVGGRFLGVGWGADVCRGAARFIAGHGLEAVRAAAGRGDHFLVRATEPDGWILVHLNLDHPYLRENIGYCDVKEALAEVLATVKELAARPQPTRPGRKRGLAGSPDNGKV